MGAPGAPRLASVANGEGCFFPPKSDLIKQFDLPIPTCYYY